MPSFYRLHGILLRVDSDDRNVGDMLDRTIRYKGADPVDPADDAALTLDVAVDRGPARRPDTARHVATTEHCDIDVWRTEEGMLLCVGATTVEIRTDEGTARGAIAPELLAARSERRRDPLYYLITLSLVILLRSRGWFPLHAAALARDGRGILLTARSGSGKSTAALTLVRSGWAYVSDDTVLLRAAGDRIGAYAFRRNFCIDPSMARHFPQLEGTDWPVSLSDASKWQVDPAQVYSGSRALSCTPRVVVLPTLVEAAESRVEPVGAKVVLEQLIRQGAFLLTSDSDAADRHLAALRQLLDQSHTYRFHAGRDVLEDPGTLHGHFSPLLETAPGP